MNGDSSRENNRSADGGRSAAARTLESRSPPARAEDVLPGDVAGPKGRPAAAGKRRRAGAAGPHPGSASVPPAPASPGKAGPSSRFRHVSFYRLVNKWKAQIRDNGLQIYLGAYSDEEDAARAADAACAERGLPRPNAAVLAGDQSSVVRTKSSIYTGVSWSKAASGWEVRIVVDGRSMYVGLFSDENEAARASDTARVANGMSRRNEALLATEGPARSAAAAAAERSRSAAAQAAAADREGAAAILGLSGSASPPAAAAAALVLPPPPRGRGRARAAAAGAAATTATATPTLSSRFKYVTWNKSNKKWQVRMRRDAKRVYIGLYTDEEEAARAADAECKARGLPEPNAAVLAGEQERVDKSATSLYEGVSWSKSNNKWKVRIKCDGKTLHVGLCDDELDAAREADAAWAARGMPRRNRDRLAAAEDDEPSDTEPVVIDAAEAARQRGERKRRRDANAAGGAAAAAGGGGGGGGGGG